jgi:hypothetical protein
MALFVDADVASGPAVWLNLGKGIGELMGLMLLGALSLACFVISLFFLRFWRATRDRFFLFFAISFAIEACGRVLLGLNASNNEQEPLIYLMRLVSFMLIIVAIVDKNRKEKSKNIE